MFSDLDLEDKEEDDWDWKAKLDVWQQTEDEDPFDVATLPLLFHEEEPQQGPDLMNPRILFVHFHDETLDVAVEGLDDYYEYMNQPTMESHDYPQNYIVDDTLPQPIAQILGEPHVAVLDAEDLWGKDELLTVWVNGEELTVNKAMVDQGLIKTDNF